MWNALPLVLPVLIPSWRFFKAIAPSPRVQWTLLAKPNQTAKTWCEFRPKPKNVSPTTLLRRLFWNPDWNDTLFVVSCAERIQQEPTVHSIENIQRRIISDLHQTSAGARYMQFRLVFVHLQHDTLVEEVVFTSDPVRV